MNLKLKLLKGLLLYSQLIYDNGKGNKYGYQAGLKSFDLFNLKNLNLQIEYNHIQAGTFSHTQYLRDYTHYNQPLAHPLGADFTELISIIDYRWRDFFFQGKVNYAYDTDYFPYGHNNSPDTITTLLFQDFKIGYLINPVTNMNLFAGFTNREVVTGGMPINNTQLFYFGFRTAISNQYFDF